MDRMSDELRAAERIAAGFAPALPEETPIGMPEQSLWASPEAPARAITTPSWMPARRLFIFGGTILFTAAGANEMYRALSVGGLTPLELIALMLYVALFAWIAFSFISAIAGFVSRIRQGGLDLGIAPGTPLPCCTKLTALLMPTYNEAPARVFAGLQAIYESLAATSALDRFRIFVLSDTTDPEIWIAEEAAFLELRRRTGDCERIFYRRRPHNVGRKAGNIAEWIQRFGGGFEHFLVLDADSLMEGETIVRLAAAMERNPQVGLIQTLPIIVNAKTPFARVQQFAGRLYGPLIAHGLAWWHGSESNYWGHNAIIRTRAFAAYAGLPQLRGRKPFGGHILSHDFVEAALLRRAGWAIHLLPGLMGSYEEGPPTLSDMLVRDRRWCQGNIQHSGVLPARGLHWVSRLHLLSGIGSYLTAPMWLLFLIAGLLTALQGSLQPPEYFPAGPSLFPTWPAQDPVRSMWVFVGTMLVLLAPKFLSYLALFFDRRSRRGSGGAFRVLISLFLETLIAGLMAPIAMFIQSGAVFAILLGRDSGWAPQRREGGRVTLREHSRRYAGATAFGLMLGISAYLIAPALLLWMLPVVIGLSLAIPLAVWTSSENAGEQLRRAGFLATPEEQNPPTVLAHAAALQAGFVTQAGNIRRLVTDRNLLEAHRHMLPPARRPGQDPIDATLLVGLARLEEATSLDAALAALTKAETASVLASARGVDLLIDLSRRTRAG
jgi:membrane glycosyltransferase